MTADDLDRLDRERRDADVRYNAALTALDGAIVAANRSPEQQEQVATALIVFLQQITAFVDTRDRAAAAAANAGLEKIARDTEALGELRTHLGVLQRAVDMLKRSSTAIPQSTAAIPQPQASSPDDYKYLGFEDQFRGSDAVIEARLQDYVPLFAGCSDVLDVGCGRGEFLAALRTAGIGARGVDANGEMAAVARERGLDAAHADALAYISALPDASLGGLMAVQVVEHLEPAYLMRLLEAINAKLRRGAPVVIETINPACWLAFFSSYIRDFTHVRPVHPETLQYLVQANGFERVTIRYSAPVPEPVKMKTIDLPAEVLASADPSSRALVQVAHAVNANAVILNTLLFSHLDYAVIGYRI